MAWPKLPHPTAGTQDWRLQRVGPVWPHHRGGGRSVAEEGLLLSLRQEAAKVSMAWALVTEEGERSLLRQKSARSALCSD